MGKLDCNKGRNNEETNLELTSFISNEDTGKIVIAQGKCPCKRTKCEHHGKCEECIAHHKEKETKYPPYCMKKTKKNKELL